MYYLSADVHVWHAFVYQIFFLGYGGILRTYFEMNARRSRSLAEARRYIDQSSEAKRRVIAM